MEENNEVETDALVHATEDIEDAMDRQQDCVPVDHNPDSPVIVPEMSDVIVIGDSEDGVVPHPQTLELPCDDSLSLMDDDYEDASKAAPPTRVDLVRPINEPQTGSFWPMDDGFENITVGMAPPTRVNLIRNEPSTDSYRLTAGDSEDDNIIEVLQTRLEPPSDSFRPMAGHFEDVSKAAPPTPVEPPMPMAGHARRAAPPTRVDYVSNESAHLNYRPNIGGLGDDKTSSKFKFHIPKSGFGKAAPPTRVDYVSNESARLNYRPNIGGLGDDKTELGCRSKFGFHLPKFGWKTRVDKPINKESTAALPITVDVEIDLPRLIDVPFKVEQPDDANNSSSTKECGGNTRCERLKNVFERCRGLLDIPRVLVFGIILYVMDVSSDITAGIHHFTAGHPVWGSLTITFVVLPAVCWAAISWTWWYYDYKATRPTATKDKKRNETLQDAAGYPAAGSTRHVTIFSFYMTKFKLNCFAQSGLDCLGKHIQQTTGNYYSGIIACIVEFCPMSATVSSVS